MESFPPHEVLHEAWKLEAGPQNWEEIIIYDIDSL